MASLSLREALLNCDYDYRYMHKRFLQLYAFCSTLWSVDVPHAHFGLSTLIVRDFFLALFLCCNVLHICVRQQKCTCAPLFLCVGPSGRVFEASVETLRIVYTTLK